MTRILVVDDAQEQAEWLQLLFEAMGHDCRTAHNGEEGVDATSAFRPQVVFIDLEMPILDGFGAAKEIKTRMNGSSPFLVALSGKVGANVARQTREAGFDMYLPKPADVNALLQLVDNLAKRELPPSH